MRRAAALLAAVVALLAAAPAGAQTAGTTVRAQGALVEPDSYDRPPPGRVMTAREVLRLAAARPEVRDTLKGNPPAYARAYLAEGGRWVPLRMCTTCGHIGCCDNSPGRHATAHHRATGHPIIRSAEPGEDWSWCYVDELMFRLREAP